MDSRAGVRNGRLLTLAVMLLIAMLSIAACGGAGSGGEEAADFSATTLEGEEYELEEKRGEVVALYFMAAY